MSTFDDREILGFEQIDSRIGEMGGEELASSGDLPVPADFLNMVKATDDDPMFVTVEVESGKSKSKRIWKPEHVRQVVDKVNKDRMGGNLGHPLLDDKAYESAFPIPQVVWVAAKAREIGGRTVGKFKGYVLKTAEARDLLRLGLIDGVSWFGDTKGKRTPDGYLEILEFEPETIDFARKGRSGMTTRVLALAGEQSSRGGNAVEPKDIAALSEDELRTHAPLLVKEIESKAKEPLTTRVGEMEATVATLTPEADLLAKIKEALKLSDGENPLEKVAALIEKIESAGKSEIKEFVQSLIARKVKTERERALVNRVLGEMHTEYEGDLTDDLKTKIEADFEQRVGEDEVLKEFIGEMNPGTGETEKREGGSSLGGRSRLGEQRGREEIQDGNVVRKTSRLTVRKVKVQ